MDTFELTILILKFIFLMFQFLQVERLVRKILKRGKTHKILDQSYFDKKNKKILMSIKLLHYFLFMFSYKSKLKFEF